MSLDTYTNLKSAIADWLNRTDLTSQIPDFISLAEAEMKRRLRRSVTRTSLTIATDATTLPADCAQLRSVYLVSAQPERDVPFRIGTAEMVAERRARAADIAGRPDTGAILAGQLLVAPTPDQTYTAEIVYYTQLTPLSGSNATNAILTEAPDAYLYGSLAQAEPYLEHDERVTVWKALFDNAIEQLNDVRDREEFGGGIESVRLPIVFGDGF